MVVIYSVVTTEPQFSISLVLFDYMFNGCDTNMTTKDWEPE